MIVEEVVSYLKKSKLQYLATMGLDGKPKVRPFQFMLEENGKLWFCTSNQKETYRELQKQPYVELCTSGMDMSWIRLAGKVVFSNNLAIKTRVFELSPLVKRIYKEPENPAFEVFYLEGATACIAKIGEAPLTYAL